MESEHNELSQHTSEQIEAKTPMLPALIRSLVTAIAAFLVLIGIATKVIAF